MLDHLMTKPQQRRRRGRERSPRHVLLQPKGVVIRESTDFFAVHDETIAAALLFIAEQSHKALAPNDVAQAVGLEPRTLRRRFAKVLGRTIASEICRVRIERAKRELVQSDRSLDVIARDVGFGSSRQMREVFCRELDVTPSNYRKQRQVTTSS